MASSSTQAGPGKRNRKTRRSREEDSSSTPGIQKIKSALRQTRRLLTKDSLAADLRIETERRLKSLQADLDKAERSRKERQYAIRYHKVKFFERQKVCRKIRQLKKALEEPEASEERDGIRQALNERRVDLNYILHYPKNQKYISLFPPEPSEQTKENLLRTETKRADFRQQVKIAMEKGEMDQEPELAMDRNSDDRNKHVMGWTAASEEDTQFSENKRSKDGQGKVIKGVADDDFFAGSDDDGD